MVNNISYNRSFKQARLSFEGLKENLRTGEKVLKGFSREFNRPHSNTYIDTKIMQYKGQERFSGIIEKLSKLSRRYSKELSHVRDGMGKYFPLLTDSMSELEKLVKEHNAANCAEVAKLIQYRLLQKGERPHNILFIIKEETKPLDSDYIKHVFPVFGLKKNADLENPETWGDNAVIVDAFSGIVQEAHKALEYLQNFMCFDPQKHTVSYRCTDSDLYERCVQELNAYKKRTGLSEETYFKTKN